MARADLLIKLVQSGINGDKTLLRKVVEAIVTEERQKQHTILADKLVETLNMQISAPERISPSNGNGTSLIAQNSSQLIHEIIPKKKLTELILSQDTIKLCQEIAQEHQRVDLLHSYNLEPRNRLLLVGPPGNGKTSLAEAIAESLMVPLLVVRYESIVGSYLGETAVRLKRLFEYAATRKCVLFFDEFETLGKERGDTHETGEIKRVVSTLLLQIDALPSYAVTICATNHPELLDRAVWRRFQVRIMLPTPTRSQLTEWFTNFSNKHKINFCFTPSTLAKRFLGLSFAEAEEFGISVVRQYVLKQPNPNIEQIVSSLLHQWAKQKSIGKNNRGTDA